MNFECIQNFLGMSFESLENSSIFCFCEIWLNKTSKWCFSHEIKKAFWKSYKVTRCQNLIKNFDSFQFWFWSKVIRNIQNKENTLVSGVLPDRAIYLVTAGMTFSTISISNNSGALVEQSKGATHYTDYGLGVASGFYNMFCISWVLPAIQNPRLGVGLEIIWTNQYMNYIINWL